MDRRAVAQEHAGGCLGAQPGQRLPGSALTVVWERSLALPTILDAGWSAAARECIEHCLAVPGIPGIQEYSTLKSRINLLRIVSVQYLSVLFSVPGVYSTWCTSITVTCTWCTNVFHTLGFPWGFLRSPGLPGLPPRSPRDYTMFQSVCQRFCQY